MLEMAFHVEPPLMVAVMVCQLLPTFLRCLLRKIKPPTRLSKTSTSYEELRLVCCLVWVSNASPVDMNIDEAFPLRSPKGFHQDVRTGRHWRKFNYFDLCKPEDLRGGSEGPREVQFVMS